MRLPFRLAMGLRFINKDAHGRRDPAAAETRPGTDVQSREWFVQRTSSRETPTRLCATGEQRQKETDREDQHATYPPDTENTPSASVEADSQAPEAARHERHPDQMPDMRGDFHTALVNSRPPSSGNAEWGLAFTRLLGNPTL